MPILSYFLVAGSVLIGLLFAADAVMPTREPLTIGSDFYGLPETAHSPQPQTGSPILRRTPAPEPDMNSAIVVASQPRNLASTGEPQAHADKPAQTAKSDAMAKATAEATLERKPATTAKTAHKASKPRKRVVRQRDNYGPDFAWGWQEERRPWGWDERRSYRGRF
jgi:hypothetical protein